VETAGIKFPDFKGSGVNLRSQRMKLPASVGQKRTKAIEQLLQELSIGNAGEMRQNRNNFLPRYSKDCELIFVPSCLCICFVRDNWVFDQLVYQLNLYILEHCSPSLIWL
jgi:hypothetical protein